MTERTVFQSLLPRQVVSLDPKASVYQAACVMTRAQCGSVLIIDAKSELIGILTERDLMSRVLAEGREPKTTLVTEVMTHNPFCVTPETTVTDAVLIMIERGFRHLPIVTTRQKIVGVFSIRDAMPREIDAAVGVAEFHEQLNDALG